MSGDFPLFKLLLKGSERWETARYLRQYVFKQLDQISQMEPRAPSGPPSPSSRESEAGTLDRAGDWPCQGVLVALTELVARKGWGKWFHKYGYNLCWPGLPLCIHHQSSCWPLRGCRQPQVFPWPIPLAWSEYVKKVFTSLRKPKKKNSVVISIPWPSIHTEKHTSRSFFKNWYFIYSLIPNHIYLDIYQFLFFSLSFKRESKVCF